MINLAVGLILFEGGLTLNLSGYKSASTMIRLLLTFGVMITWFGSTVLIWFLCGHLFEDRPVAMSMLAASLVIVTGPTVIAPLLRRITDFLQRSLSPDLIVRVENVQSQEQLFGHMVERFVAIEPRIDREQVVKELFVRERSFPTSLGHGIAVPHAYGRLLDLRMCAIAQIPSGLDFQAPDKQPVQLVFLLLSPLGDPEGHLATMGEIARLVSNITILEQLIKGSDPDTLLSILKTPK
ncbi:MAG: PTS sugar transporter subunit IIA [Sumerlaeia bacterium]